MATEAPPAADVAAPEESPPVESPPTASPPLNPVKLSTSRRRSWKERLAFLQNFKFFANFLIPLFFFWLIFLSPPIGQPKLVTPTTTAAPTTTTVPPAAAAKGRAAGAPAVPPPGALPGQKITINNCDKCYKAVVAILIMGGYWLTGCMPIPGAALLPIGMYPLMQIQEAKTFLKTFMTDTNMMAFATILLALSTWSSGLTKRAALKILALTGGNLRRANFLVMILAALMSMWYPDTAVMICVMDIVDKMGAEIKATVSSGSLGDERMVEMKAIEAKHKESAPKSEEEAKEGQEPEKPKEVEEASKPEPETDLEHPYHAFDETKLNTEVDLIISHFKISVLHSVGIVVCIGGLYWPHCSTGGIQLITTNSIKVDVGTWMSFCGPVMTILLPLTIWYLDFFNFILPSFKIVRKRKSGPTPNGATPALETPPEHQHQHLQNLLKFETKHATRDELEALHTKNYDSLGAPNSHEISVLILLILAEFGFMLSDPRFMFGWSRNLNKDPKLTLPKVSTFAMFIAVLAFIIPKSLPAMFRCPEEKPTFSALIGWKVVQANFPWGLIIFIGAGLAIAQGTALSGLTDLIFWNMFRTLGKGSPYVYLILLMLLSYGLACVVGNTAASGIIKMISVQVAIAIGMPPEIFLIPTVAVTAMAFVTPAGTPALALLHMRSEDRHIGHYLRVGLSLSVMGFVVIYAVGAGCIGLHGAGLDWDN